MTPARWARRNLFSNATDSVLSALVISTGLWLVVATVHWAFGDARWAVVTGSLRVLLVGVYPADQTWRAWTAAFLLAGILGATLGTAFSWHPSSRRGFVGLQPGTLVTLWTGHVGNSFHALFGVAPRSKVANCAQVSLSAGHGVQVEAKVRRTRSELS